MMAFVVKLIGIGLTVLAAAWIAVTLYVNIACQLETIQCEEHYGNVGVWYTLK